MEKTSEAKVRSTVTLYDKDYVEYQAKRSWLRKFIRRFYLKQILRYVEGKAIDFGCGIGELLARLPSDSIGFEINEAAVRYCKKRGLQARHYEPETDNYQFKECESENYETFTMCHVLEHLRNPDSVFRLILQSCNRLGIRKIIIVVPGLRGFKVDKTHRTFIDEDYLTKHNLWHVEGYHLAEKKYFPLNFASLGKYFTYHELIVIYERIS